LDSEDWFDRAAISRIFRVSHVSGCFAEANQLVVRNRLDALPKVFDSEFGFGDHLRSGFAMSAFPLGHFLGHQQE
jgi:hypothetical protein